MERELLRSRPAGNFLRVLALALCEQLAHHPRARARVAKPVDVETRGELLVQDGLQLPRSQIARRIVSRIDVHEGVGLVVLEARGTAEKRNVKIGQLLPRNLATIQRTLVNELGAVPPQKVQLLEAGCAQKFPDSVGAQLCVAEQPAPVLHAMVEQHRIGFGYGVVAEPAELECVIRTGVAEVQGVSQLVEKSVVVALPPMWPQHQIHLFGDAHRGTERSRALPFALTDIEDDASASGRIDAHLRDLATHHRLHLAARKSVVVFRGAEDRQRVRPLGFGWLDAKRLTKHAAQGIIPH